MASEDGYSFWLESSEVFMKEFPLKDALRLARIALSLFFFLEEVCFAKQE